MLTADDVRSIPLFSTLAVAELERLAETSADLHLGAGEFAVHEGGDRAFYAVLAGKIEVVKLFDGIERTLGWRVPGTIFGEVPIAFGTVFVGGYRAAEPSRVFRVDPKHYYAVAATSPEVVAKVGALARERMGGAAGHRGRAAKGTRDDGRQSLGRCLQRVAPVPRAQPDYL
jgi:thioredoxin reductase (NADPH)